MSFASTRTVKAVRKAHKCVGCDRMIEIGQPAERWSGMTDGDFASVIYHVDCRAAEIELNKLASTDWDEWMGLADIEDDDWDWLIEEYPAVAARMGLPPYPDETGPSIGAISDEDGQRKPTPNPPPIKPEGKDVGS